MKLIASAIVRNEESRFLDLWLQHLLEFCDEVRLLDDNSEDETPWIASGYKGVHVTTNEGPAFYEYESKARNELLRWTMKGEPDFVLSIDADEFVGDPEAVRRSVERGQQVYVLQMDEVWKADANALHLRIDGHWGPRKCPILWRAPREFNDFWLIPDRKLACGREPLQVRRTRFKLSGSSVYHFGWTREQDRQRRAERYFEHDQGNFHQDRHLQSILWPDEKILMNSVPWPEGLIPIRDRILTKIS